MRLSAIRIPRNTPCFEAWEEWVVYSEQSSHVVCDYLKDTSKTPFLPVIRQCKSNAHEGSIPPSVMT